jgi:hypothetical protein
VSDAFRHRRGARNVIVARPDGTPLADQQVVVEQLRHEFGFGNIGFDLIPHATGAESLDDLAADWLELFNVATLPFYWGQFEPERGQPRTEPLLATARWFVERGVRVKGHPLVWHTVKAPWMDALPLAEVERVTLERVRREVTDFRGLIGSWEVVNEAVIMPVFENEPDGVPNAVTKLARARGRLPLIRAAFDEARAADPDAVLLINDFDLSSAYEILIEALLEAGVRIDAIGLQTHMHQGYWGEEKTLGILDRFSRYGLPIHFTETTILSGQLMPAEIVDLNDYQVPDWPSTPEGEERQADEIGLHAVRGGDNVGEHTIVFTTLGETLELVHKGHSRDSYARGALLAAKFLATKTAGRYTMADVLGL